MTIIFIIIFWAVCGFISYGRMFAYWQRAYLGVMDADGSNDRNRELLTALAGPIALLSAEIFLRYVSQYGPQGFLL